MMQLQRQHLSKAALKETLRQISAVNADIVDANSDLVHFFNSLSDDDNLIEAFKSWHNDIVIILRPMKDIFDTWSCLPAQSDEQLQYVFSEIWSDEDIRDLVGANSGNPPLFTTRHAIELVQHALFVIKAHIACNRELFEDLTPGSGQNVNFPDAFIRWNARQKALSAFSVSEVTRIIDGAQVASPAHIN